MRYPLRIHSTYVIFAVAAACMNGAMEETRCSAQSLDEYVLFGASYVRVGAFGDVSSGLVGSNGLVLLEGGKIAAGVISGGDVIWDGVEIGTTQRDGTLRAAGNVYYDGFIKLYGDLRAGGSVSNLSTVTGLDVVGNVEAGGEVHFIDFFSDIVGEVHEHVDPAPTVPPVSMPIATPFTAGGPNVVGATFDELVLNPGSYGHVVAQGAASLALRSGEYYLETLSADHFLDLKFDLSAGPINVYVEDYLALRSVKDIYVNGVNINGFTPVDEADLRQWASQITFEVAKDVHYGGDLIGTIFAPHGTILVDTFGSITGALWADSLDLAGATSASMLFAPSERLQLRATSAPGDFDFDGDVDGDDYAAWADRFGAGGADYDGLAFLRWQAAYGDGIAGPRPIPEPSTALIVAAFATVATACSRRRHV
ncbi:MAG: hypothetical protein KDA61_06785 [Planctomycetales bacterium]|nr:hypothetical protein [Planctomycetales bacterium]